MAGNQAPATLNPSSTIIPTSLPPSLSPSSSLHTNTPEINTTIHNTIKIASAAQVKKEGEYEDKYDENTNPNKTTSTTELNNHSDEEVEDNFFHTTASEGLSASGKKKQDKESKEKRDRNLKSFEFKAYNININLIPRIIISKTPINYTGEIPDWLRFASMFKLEVGASIGKEYLTQQLCGISHRTSTLEVGYKLEDGLRTCSLEDYTRIKKNPSKWVNMRSKSSALYHYLGTCLGNPDDLARHALVPCDNGGEAWKVLHTYHTNRSDFHIMSQLEAFNNILQGPKEKVREYCSRITIAAQGLVSIGYIKLDVNTIRTRIFSGMKAGYSSVIGYYAISEIGRKETIDQVISRLATHEDVEERESRRGAQEGVKGNWRPSSGKVNANNEPGGEQHSAAAAASPSKKKKSNSSYNTSINTQDPTAARLCFRCNKIHIFDNRIDSTNKCINEPQVCGYSKCGLTGHHMDRCFEVHPHLKAAHDKKRAHRASLAVHKDDKDESDNYQQEESIEFIGISTDGKPQNKERTHTNASNSSSTVHTTMLDQLSVIPTIDMNRPPTHFKTHIKKWISSPKVQEFVSKIISYIDTGASHHCIASQVNTPYNKKISEVNIYTVDKKGMRSNNIGTVQVMVNDCIVSLTNATTNKLYDYNLISFGTLETNYGATMNISKGIATIRYPDGSVMMTGRRSELLNDLYEVELTITQQHIQETDNDTKLAAFMHASRRTTATATSAFSVSLSSIPRTMARASVAASSSSSSSLSSITADDYSSCTCNNETCTCEQEEEEEGETAAASSSCSCTTSSCRCRMVSNFVAGYGHASIKSHPNSTSRINGEITMSQMAKIFEKNKLASDELDKEREQDRFHRRPAYHPAVIKIAQETQAMKNKMERLCNRLEIMKLCRYVFPVLISREAASGDHFDLTAAPSSSSSQYQPKADVFNSQMRHECHPQSSTPDQIARCSAYSSLSSESNLQCKLIAEHSEHCDDHLNKCNGLKVVSIQGGKMVLHSTIEIEGAMIMRGSQPDSTRYDMITIISEFSGVWWKIRHDGSEMTNGAPHPSEPNTVNPNGQYTFTVGVSNEWRYFITCNSNHNSVARYITHHDHPNCVLIKGIENGVPHLRLAALNKINPGQLLTVDLTHGKRITEEGIPKKIARIEDDDDGSEIEDDDEVDETAGTKKEMVMGSIGNHIKGRPPIIDSQTRIRHVGDPKEQHQAEKYEGHPLYTTPAKSNKKKKVESESGTGDMRQMVTEADKKMIDLQNDIAISALKDHPFFGKPNVKRQCTKQTLTKFDTSFGVMEEMNRCIKIACWGQYCATHTASELGLKVDKSTIKNGGYGLYTTINRKAKDIIGPYTGKLCESKAAAGKGTYIMCFEGIDSKETYINALCTATSVVRFTNDGHSKDNNNAEFICDGVTVNLVLTHQVNANSEILACYGPQYWAEPTNMNADSSTLIVKGTEKSATALSTRSRTAKFVVQIKDLIRSGCNGVGNDDDEGDNEKGVGTNYPLVRSNATVGNGICSCSNSSCANDHGDKEEEENGQMPMDIDDDNDYHDGNDEGDNDNLYNGLHDESTPAASSSSSASSSAPTPIVTPTSNTKGQYVKQTARMQVYPAGKPPAASLHHDNFSTPAASNKKRKILSAKSNKKGEEEGPRDVIDISSTPSSEVVPGAASEPNLLVPPIPLPTLPVVAKPIINQPPEGPPVSPFVLPVAAVAAAPPVSAPPAVVQVAVLPAPALSSAVPASQAAPAVVLLAAALPLSSMAPVASPEMVVVAASPATTAASSAIQPPTPVTTPLNTRTSRSRAARDGKSK